MRPRCRCNTRLFLVSRPTMYSHLSTLKRHFAKLLRGHALAPAPAAANADVRICWRLIHAELGLAAWVAEGGPARRAGSPAARAILALADPDDSESPRELARQLAATHLGRLVVLPLWQGEQLQKAGVPAEVALHLLLQRLRDDGLVGAAAPMVLSANKTRDLARCYAQRYHASTQSMARNSPMAVHRDGSHARHWVVA